MSTTTTADVPARRNRQSHDALWLAVGRGRGVDVAAVVAAWLVPFGTNAGVSVA